jgi:hypothetical protein
MGKKKTRQQRVLVPCADKRRLLDLAFLVENVLAHDRIEFLYLHFTWLIALVLGSRVEVTGPGARDQADLFTCCFGHGTLPPSDLFAACAKRGEHLLDTLLVDETHRAGGYAKAHPTLLALDPKTMVMEIGQKPPLGLVMGVGDVATGERPLSGHLTNFGHEAPPSERKTEDFIGGSKAGQGNLTGSGVSSVTLAAHALETALGQLRLGRVRKLHQDVL